MKRESELKRSPKPNTPVPGVQTGEKPTPRVPRFAPWAAVGVALLVWRLRFCAALDRLPFWHHPTECGRRKRQIGGGATVVRLTSYPGTEDMPSLLPDGTQVAFRWNGEAEETSTSA